MATEVLDCISITVPEAALETFEAALGSVCRAVSFFHDEANDQWNIQAVKERGEDEDRLAAALAMAEMVTGFGPSVIRSQVPAGGWLARTAQAFPEQLIGSRFAIRGTHIKEATHHGRITLTLDAGLAFGTGEHQSTSGCLLALEHVARRKIPGHILDLGTGSGILAIATARRLRRSVLATDIDPRAARVARENAQLNGVARLVRAVRADGWRSPAIRRRAPFGLVFANILARPLCAMARQLSVRLRPGGLVILAGLLTTQANWVLAAHRRVGLVLQQRIEKGAWTTLILRRPV
jgi:ribosomal protein L11 methyltransferase